MGIDKLNPVQMDALNRARTVLTCFLCESMLMDPVTLSNCLHSFCRECLYKEMKKIDAQQCPECFLPFRPKEILTNFHLDGIACKFRSLITAVAADSDDNYSSNNNKSRRGKEFLKPTCDKEMLVKDTIKNVNTNSVPLFSVNVDEIPRTTILHDVKDKSLKLQDSSSSSIKHKTTDSTNAITNLTTSSINHENALNESVEMNVTSLSPPLFFDDSSRIPLEQSSLRLSFSNKSLNNHTNSATTKKTSSKTTTSLIHEKVSFLEITKHPNKNHESTTTQSQSQSQLHHTESIESVALISLQLQPVSTPAILGVVTEDLESPRISQATVNTTVLTTNKIFTVTTTNNDDDGSLQRYSATNKQEDSNLLNISSIKSCSRPITSIPPNSKATNHLLGCNISDSQGSGTTESYDNLSRDRQILQNFLVMAQEEKKAADDIEVPESMFVDDDIEDTTDDRGYVVSERETGVVSYDGSHSLVDSTGMDNNDYTSTENTLEHTQHTPYLVLGTSSLFPSTTTVSDDKKMKHYYASYMSLYRVGSMLQCRFVTEFPRVLASRVHRDRLRDTPTHYILQCDGLCCTLSYDYLLAKLCECWIVSYDWLTSCLLHQTQVAEDPFQIKVCHNGDNTTGSVGVSLYNSHTKPERKPKKITTEGLFGGYIFTANASQINFDGSVLKSLDDLKLLVYQGGGNWIEHLVVEGVTIDTNISDSFKQDQVVVFIRDETITPPLNNSSSAVTTFNDQHSIHYITSLEFIESICNFYCTY